MNPALRIIDKCGGFRAVAKMLGVDVSGVHRWTYPKERGGTDGRIPSRRQQPLINAALAAGIPLSPTDFFDLGDTGEPGPLALSCSDTRSVRKGCSGRCTGSGGKLLALIRLGLGALARCFVVLRRPAVGSAMLRSCGRSQRRR